MDSMGNWISRSLALLIGLVLAGALMFDQCPSVRNPWEQQSFEWWLSKVLPEGIDPLYTENSEAWFICVHREGRSLVVSAWKNPAEPRTTPYHYAIDGEVEGRMVSLLDTERPFRLDPVSLSWNGQDQFGRTFVAPIVPEFSGDLRLEISEAIPQPQDGTEPRHDRIQQPERVITIPFD